MDIYCDSSFNKGVAGIGIVIIKNGIIKKNVFSFKKCQNNNFGELWAVYISSILSGGEPCTIHTDSQTALDYLEGRRDKEYEAKHKDWTPQQEKMHKEMKILSAHIRRVSPNITFVKVKGHQKNLKHSGLANNMADMMAKFGLSKYYRT